MTLLYHQLPVSPGKLTAEHRRTLANGEATGHGRQGHSTLAEVTATCREAKDESTGETNGKP